MQQLMTLFLKDEMYGNILYMAGSAGKSIHSGKVGPSVYVIVLGTKQKALLHNIFKTESVEPKQPN